MSGLLGRKEAAVHSIADLFASTEDLKQILDQFPKQRIAVVGDFFLDKYLVIDASLEEPSIETGLPAHQVTEVRNSPGAAGTVVNNLVALEAGRVAAFGVVGNDGNGYELREALSRMGVDVSSLLTDPAVLTPTYMKPVRRTPDGVETELSRLDVLNRARRTEKGEDLRRSLSKRIREFDVLLVMDQVCHIVDEPMRAMLAEIGVKHPGLFVLVDSRFAALNYRNVRIKPNAHEIRDALMFLPATLVDKAVSLADRCRRDVFVTFGKEGIVVAGPETPPQRVKAVKVGEPTDPTGAGDSASAGIALASVSGATNLQAAAVGNLVASITVEQLRTTGVASREKVLERFVEIASSAK
jgi:rfaE bifunctional protein kinase chain/domain